LFTKQQTSLKLTAKITFGMHSWHPIRLKTGDHFPKDVVLLRSHFIVRMKLSQAMHRSWNS